VTIDNPRDDQRQKAVSLDGIRHPKTGSGTHLMAQIDGLGVIYDGATSQKGLRRLVSPLARFQIFYQHILSPFSVVLSDVRAQHHQVCARFPKRRL